MTSDEAQPGSVDPYFVAGRDSLLTEGIVEAMKDAPLTLYYGCLVADWETMGTGNLGLVDEKANTATVSYSDQETGEDRNRTTSVSRLLNVEHFMVIIERLKRDGELIARASKMASDG